jgi:lysophospholipase L1-like esterase
MTLLDLARRTILSLSIAIAPVQASAGTRTLRHAPRANLAVQPVSRMAESWWRARFIDKQQELRRGPVDLLWIGDSITQNWERNGPQDFLRFQPVWQRFYGDRHAVNLGFKGDSTCHLLWRIDHGELDGIAPRAAIVLIGANNFGHVHTDADQTYDGIVAVLDRIHTKLPATRILLLGVLPSLRSPWVTANTARLDDRLRASIRVGRPWLSYRDVGPLFGAPGRIEPSRYLDPRLVPPEKPLHPTAQTQELIAQAIEPDIALMLGDRTHR